MRTIKFRLLITILLVVAFGLIGSSLSKAPERRAFINGKILSLDANNSTHQALLIDKGMIVAIGSNKSITDLIDPLTLITNLNGKTMMPGIIDAHSQFPSADLRQDTTFKLFDVLAMARRSNKAYVSQGITSTHSPVNSRLFHTLRWAQKIGLLDLRLVLFPLLDGLGKQWRDGEVDLAQYNTAKFTAGPVQLTVDQSIQDHKAYLSSPYQGAYEGDSNYQGYPLLEAAALRAEIQKLQAAGLQIAIEGHGDAAISDIIAAFELTQQEANKADPRLLLLHAQMATNSHLYEFKQLGISPSFASASSYYSGDLFRESLLGPERASQINPGKSAAAAGLRFSIHLDATNHPMQPFLLVWSAVNRLSANGQVIGDTQRISTLQALRAVTIDAAWQVFQEGDRGSLEVGKWADVIILSDDPMQNPAAIRHIKVLETLIAGKSVYRDYTKP